MANWRHTINLKEHLTDDESDQSVVKCCNVIIPQLERILDKEREAIDKNRPGSLKDDEYILDELERMIDEFKWIVESIADNNDPNDYSFDTWLEAFNEYLSQLYDLGDTSMYYNTFFDKGRFLWVS